MDQKKFENKTKRIAGATKVDIVSVEHLNPEYEIEVLSDQRTTPTGLLEIVRLNPTKPGLPRFIFRWDENADVLDVDIYKDEKYRNDLWNKNVYNGHHTRRISNEAKIFESDIKRFDSSIFKGKIDVGLFIKITIKESCKLIDSIKVVHKRVKIENESKGTNNIKANKGS